jgi:hypothetical protein
LGRGCVCGGGGGAPCGAGGGRAGRGPGPGPPGSAGPRAPSTPGGVRGRGRRMQGPGDPGEEATPDARSVSAHGRAGGMRGRQRERMESTLLEMRGRARRRLGEAQDADEGEMFSEVMPGGGRTADSHQTGSESQPLKRPIRTVASRIMSVMGAECGLDPRQSHCLRSVTGWRSLRM